MDQWIRFIWNVTSSSAKYGVESLFSTKQFPRGALVLLATWVRNRHIVCFLVCSFEFDWTVGQFYKINYGVIYSKIDV